MNNILTTTTNNVEGFDITRYFQPISSNVVVGTNLFSDISASFSDFFGGRSSSYEEKLSKIYAAAFSKLKNQGASLGANAVIGISIDIDEISGGGKQMFMITITGTPVIIAKAGEEVKTGLIKSSLLDGRHIANIIEEKRLAEALKNESYEPDQEDLAIIEKSDSGLLNEAVLQFLSNHIVKPGSYGKEFLSYFRNLDSTEASALIYHHLLHRPSAEFVNNSQRILIPLQLVDYAKINQFLASGNEELMQLALKLLITDKTFYEKDDKDLIADSIAAIEAGYPVVAEFYVTKKGMFSTGELEKWKCRCGASHDAHIKVCTNCQQSIFGVHGSQQQPDSTIAHLKIKKEAIEFLSE